MNTKQIKNLTTGVSGMYCMYCMALAIITIVLPLYMNSLNYSETQIGFIVGCASLMSVFATPIWGIIDDRLKKTTTLLFIIGIALGLIAIILGVTKIFFIFLVLRAIFEVFSCGTTPLMDKTALELETEYQVPYTKMRIFGSIGYSLVLFPVIYLIEQFNNYQVALLCVTICFVIFLWFVYKVKPLDAELRQKHVAHEPGMMSKAIKQLFSNKAYLLIVGVNMIVAACNEVMGAFQGLHLEKTLLAPGYAISLSIFIASFVSEVPCMYFAPKVHAKIGWYKCVVIATLAFLLKFTLEYFAPSWPLFLATRLLHGISISLLLSPVLMLIKGHVSPRVFTTAITISLSIKGIMNTLLSITIGNVNDMLKSTYGMYYIVIPLILLALFLLLIYYYQFEKNEQSC